jgi:hypothetical protein
MLYYRLSGDVLTVTVDGRRLEFQRVTLTFLGHGTTDALGLRSNKTVEQTLVHKRYVKLVGEVMLQFSGSMREPLGEFLLILSLSDDREIERLERQLIQYLQLAVPMLRFAPAAAGASCAAS